MTDLKIARQPLADVRWLKPSELSANDWNPNKQAPPEFRLLKTSILENGWTQPIVARPRAGTLQIVDGFHRWTLAQQDAQVGDLTRDDAGNVLVPVVVLPEVPDEVAKAATIRHNRARGTHHVLRMADIVADLAAQGLTQEQIQRELGMDEEEVERLLDRGNMLKRGTGNTTGFSKGWGVNNPDIPQEQR